MGDYINLEKINLNHTYYFFKDIKNTDTNLLSRYDDLPLHKILHFSPLDIIVEFLFQIRNEHYPQININKCEYDCEYYFLSIL